MCFGPLGLQDFRDLEDLLALPYIFYKRRFSKYSEDIPINDPYSSFISTMDRSSRTLGFGGFQSKSQQIS
jgi:hypothetical protein